MEEEKRLYVAYGSNLNLYQMKVRCPTAKLVGTGIVKDHELMKNSSTDMRAIPLITLNDLSRLK